MRSLTGAAFFAAAVYACSSDLDCNLNGVCNAGSCACDAPWRGNTCEVMGFKPVTFPQGYGMVPNTTSWGGNVLQDSEGTWHLLAARMTNDCPLSNWHVNSRVDHATSKSITGPYEFQDVALNTWAHNPAPVRLPDGTYALFHIGDATGGPDGGRNCSGNSTEIEVEASSRGGAKGGSTIHTSSSLSGPWEPLIPNPLPTCDNVSPWVHPNGTIFAICRHGVFYRTEDIRSNWTQLRTVPQAGGPAGAYEDPFVYTDTRGHWHVLNHVWSPAPAYQCVNTTVSAHIFSEDGFNWHTTPTQPFTSQIQLSSGETVTVATRERPKLVFNASGVPTHLLNGVCGATACGPTHCSACKQKFWDYTLVAPLDV